MRLILAIILEAWSLGVGVDVLADALMPIVERVAREVLYDAITAATFDGLGSVDADAIVRRVMGDE